MRNTSNHLDQIGACEQLYHGRYALSMYWRIRKLQQNLKGVATVSDRVLKLRQRMLTVLHIQFECIKPYRVVNSVQRYSIYRLLKQANFY